MRIFSSALLLLSMISMAFGQTKTVSLSWENQILEYPTYKFELPGIEGFGFRATQNGMAPVMNVLIEIPSGSSLNNITLIPGKETSFSTTSFPDLGFSGTSYEIDPTITSSPEGKTYLSVDVIPLKLKNNQYLRLEDFTLSYQLKQKSRERNRAASPSLLATGDWYEIGLLQDGVYKLDRGFLASMGLPVNSLDPRNIRIFGYGGGQLPEKNMDVPFDDLRENSIEVIGEADGSFDQNDYVLFYGQRQHVWKYDAFGNYYHEQNIYSDTTYYYLTIDQGPGLRIQTENTSGLTETQTLDYFHDAQFHELEQVNLQKAGQDWYGEYFDITPSYNFTFSFPNAVQGGQGLLIARAVARSSSPTTMDIQSGGQTLVQLNMPATAVSNPDAAYARPSEKSVNFNISGDNVVLTARFNKQGNPGALAWLDFIELIVPRKLQLGQQPLLIRNLDAVSSGGVAKYELSNITANHRVWRLTDPTRITQVSMTTTGNQGSFKYTTDTLESFAILGTTGFRTPSFFRSIANQDLHGSNPVDMVIVAHPNFLDAANELADFHLEDRGLKCLVVTPKQVYREFSSGAQDLMAIRSLMRHLYTTAPTLEERPDFLLLFGDASYDYKNRVSTNHNFVPTYSSEVSLSLNSTDVTDDFYGYLDPEEGRNLSNAIMDIGIGRIPVKSVAEANGAVNKIKVYRSSQSYGEWRNNILFISDDVDDDWEVILVKGAENQAKRVDTVYPNLNVGKIYLDAYNQQSTAAGDRYPDATEQMLKSMERGLLLVNYIGHGGELGWADEGILNANDVNAFRNLDALNVLVTITCEFTRYDDPDRTSAGERMVVNPQGGSIAIFSTTRQVGATNAISLGNAFYRHIFEKENGFPLPMGEAMRRLKNSQLSNDTKLDFSYFGDPSLPLATPAKQVRTTAINAQALNQFTDTINALTKVEIQGEVVNVNGGLASDFNGIVVPVVYDKYSELVTRNNDGQGLEDDGYPLTFLLQKNILYKGKAEVVNGAFDFAFVVPKDIAYQVGNGRISYYAFSDSSDAAGYYDSLLIGGSNPNPSLDNQGPEVQIFMNDENFVFGGVTNDKPTLIAKISDENGVNTVGNGIGHDLTATLDEETENSIVLNDFYESDLNSYQSGTVEYPLSKLEPGRHNLKLKVWDVYNNSSDAYTEFVVAESSELALEHVLNYPNPFTTYTEFHFEHNRPGEPLEVRVQVFTVSGKLVKTIQEEVTSSGFRVNSITWDGLDDFGDQIGKGVYVYQVRVRSKSDNAVAEEYEKLVILR